MNRRLLTTKCPMHQRILALHSSSKEIQLSWQGCFYTLAGNQETWDCHWGWLSNIQPGWAWAASGSRVSAVIPGAPSERSAASACLECLPQCSFLGAAHRTQPPCWERPGIRKRSWKAPSTGPALGRGHGGNPSSGSASGRGHGRSAFQAPQPGPQAVNDVSSSC